MGDEVEARVGGARLSRRPTEHDIVGGVFGDLRVLWPLDRTGRYHVRCTCKWSGSMPRDRIVSEGRCPSCASIVQRFLGSALGRSMLELYPADVLGRWWAHRAAAVTADQIRAELRGECSAEETTDEAPRVVLFREVRTTCERCGGPLAPSKRKPRRYCSPRCGEAARRAKVKEEKAT